jgi:hypothetical protein
MVSKVSVTVWAAAMLMPKAQQSAAKQCLIRLDANQLDCVMVFPDAS